VKICQYALNTEGSFKKLITDHHRQYRPHGNYRTTCAKVLDTMRKVQYIVQEEN